MKLLSKKKKNMIEGTQTDSEKYELITKLNKSQIKLCHTAHDIYDRLRLSCLILRIFHAFFRARDLFTFLLAIQNVHITSHHTTPSIHILH